MIPAELSKEKRWVAWRPLSGKKPPVGDDGMPLSSWNDPESWLSLEDARRRSVDVEGGIGFVLGDGFSGIDLDDCRDPETGTVDPRAQAILYICEGAYAEVSPSGKGFKIFGRGASWLELTFRPDRVDVGRKTAGYFTVMDGGSIGGTHLPALDLDIIEAYFSAPPEAESSRSAPAPRPLMEVIRPGSQNQELFREACRHTRDGKTEDEVFAIVRAVAAERCPNAAGARPWTDADFRAIARSASRYRPAEDPFPKTESGDAEFFARLHSDLVRYDHRRRRWLRYDGDRWAPQTAGEVDRLALETVRARAAAAVRSSGKNDNWKEDLKWARAGESASRRNHVLELSRIEPIIADPGDWWDRDPWLLGVEGGVVDLRTGEGRRGRPEDRVTMRAGAPYDPEAECPTWEAFVKEILQDNPDLGPYVQRALGYSLTGDCREEVFFLLTGDGRNGKGTLINTAARVMGDYAADLAFHSLERSRDGDKSTNDIAKLAGKRLVTASETSGARLNEGRIKTMTGRDPVTARFLYAEEFTFIPEFKLWLGVNHLPRVRDDSVGFWSRPHRIPFLQSYAGREDRTLKDRLAAEAPGILAWMVRGCLAWQACGLSRPAAVEKAGEEYRLSQEPLAEFYEDRCVLMAEASTTGSALRDAYLGWCDERKVWPRERLGPQSFSQALVGRFGEARKTRAGVEYFGIGLRAREN